MAQHDECVVYQTNNRLVSESWAVRGEFLPPLLYPHQREDVQFSLTMFFLNEVGNKKGCFLEFQM